MKGERRGRGRGEGGRCSREKGAVNAHFFHLVCCSRRRSGAQDVIVAPLAKRFLAKFASPRKTWSENTRGRFACTKFLARIVLRCVVTWFENTRGRVACTKLLARILLWCIVTWSETRGWLACTKFVSPRSIVVVYRDLVGELGGDSLVRSYCL